MNFVNITLEGLIFSNILVIGTMLITLLFSTKFQWKILIAAIRTFGQLLIVGYFLRYIFKNDSWYSSMGTLLVMHFAAGFICLDAVGLSYRNMDFLMACFISIAAGMALTFVITNIFVIHFKPWYRADYLVPLSGMVIGNSITAISLYHKNVISSIQKRRSFIQSLIAMGIEGKKAISGFTSEGFQTGLMPTITAMLMLGIVKLPGMMTGQIIGGSEVMQAIYYQIVVMFMIAFSSAVSMLLFRWMHGRLIFDKDSFLREKIIS